MKIIMVLGFILSLSSCGGGGGGGGVSSANSVSSASSVAPQIPTSVSLSKLNTTVSGTVLTMDLVGVDSDGKSYTGTVSVKNLEQQILNGVVITPREFLVKGYFAGSSYQILEIRNVYNVDFSAGFLLSWRNYRNSDDCISVSPYRMPDTVKVGDFGAATTLTCSSFDKNNGTFESEWRVESSGSNFVLIIKNIKKDISGFINDVETISYILNGAGDIQGIKHTVAVPSNNYSITFSSK